MSQLIVYAESEPARPRQRLLEGDAIRAKLASVGVRFERWKALRDLAEGATQDQILAAYGPELERLKSEGGYQMADVVRIARGTADTARMRQKFLSEHRHTEDEVRFFVEGGGTFYLRLGGEILACGLERDDLIGVPANTRHWFDMGTAPYFCAIRVFTDPEGWVGHFTGDPIAARFPTHDALSAAPA